MIQTFWIFITLIFYCYLGYPILLWILAKLKPWPVKKSPLSTQPDDFPYVSIVMSLHNEEDVIEGKIKNLLSLDYPQNKLEILIGSDGSIDQTNTLIKSIASKQIRLITNPHRQGKTAILNQLVPLAQGKIIVFTDARQILANNALKQLASNFNDPNIGCVSGELMFSAKTEGATSSGVSLYWKYEKFIRYQESRIHSMLGATGAIYAIKKELYTMTPENIVLDDMFIPLKIILKKYRAIFDLEAKAFDQVANRSKEEYTRKVRTLFGNYQIFSVLPEIFNPFKSPVAFQMFSHKLLRLLIPFFMIAVFVINLFLLGIQIFQVIFFLQIMFYLLALIGSLAGQKNYGILKPISKVTYVPYVFCLLNFSAFVGLIRFIQSNQSITWEKARKQ